MKIWEKGVLYSPLYCYLFLGHDYLVCLINRKLIFWYFEYAYRFVLGFHNVRIVHLLVYCPRWFVHQSDLVILVRYHNSVKIGKHLEICNDFIYCKSPYLRCTSTAANRKDSYYLLFTAKIKLVLFIRILKMLNLVHMRKFVKFGYRKTFIVKADLISSDNTDTGKRDHLEDQINLKLISIYMQFSHNFFRLRTHPLHIEQINRITSLWDRQPFIEHLYEKDQFHLLRQREDKLVHRNRIELCLGLREKMRKVDSW